MADFPTPARGVFIDREHLFPLRVYFEDTDVSGIVYHANYLRYFERARSDMLREAGVDQRAAIEAGTGAYAVTEMTIQWKRPARLDDALLVISTLGEIRAASCSIHQRVMRDDAILAQASVTAALLSPEGRPVQQPADWVEKFKRLVSEGEE